jgi:hypothetical protein
LARNTFRLSLPAQQPLACQRGATKRGAPPYLSTSVMKVRVETQESKKNLA